ncbi:MAG: hypothetical protein DMG67_00485 [Acidobacteria bacterium]|nr:MAG: hypothetical protein DMG67_00485 [Acidobacteriota bacterium]
MAIHQCCSRSWDLASAVALQARSTCGPESPDLVEVVVSWPGLGPLLFEAILGRDLYVVIGAILFSTMFLVVGTLVSDLLLFAADPRIRAQ